MCCQKSCEALAAPPGGELFAWHLPDEREAGLSRGAGSSFDLPLRQPAGATNGTAAAHSGDRASLECAMATERPGAVESRGLESGKEVGVPALPGRGPDAAAQATTKAASLASVSSHGTQQGVESGFRCADQLADGRRFRALTIMDVFTRESLPSKWDRD
jgi:hypothetical protein